MKKTSVTFHEQEFVIHEDTLFDVPGDEKPLNVLDIEEPEDFTEPKRPVEIFELKTLEPEVHSDKPTDMEDVEEQKGHADVKPQMVEIPRLDIAHVESARASIHPDRSIPKSSTPRDDTAHRSADAPSKDVLALDKENTRLKQENKKLSITVQDLKESQVRNMQEIKSLRAVENRNQMEREKRTKIEERGVHRQLEKEQKLREAKEKECESLTNRMKLEKTNAVNAIGKWKEALEAERNRVGEGKKHITSLQALLEEEKNRSAANNHDFESEKLELKNEIARLSQLSGTSSSQLTHERQESARLQSELEQERLDRQNLEQTIQYESRRFADREKDLENLENTVSAVRSERDRLNTRVKGVEAELSEKTAALAEIQVKLNTFRDDVDTNRTQRREVEDQLSKFKLGYQSQYEKLCEYHSEIASLRARYEDLQRENLEVRQNGITQQESLQRQIDDYATQVSELQHDYEDRVTALKRLQNEHEATRRALEDTEVQLEAKATELTETQTLLDKERAEWSTMSEIHADTEATLQSKLQSIAEEAQRQNRILSDLQTEAFDNKHELHSIRDKNASLNAEVDALQEVHSTTLAELEVAKKRADEEESKSAFLKTELTEAREKATENAQTAHDLSDRLRRREVDLSGIKEDARRSREELNAEIFDLRTKLNRLGIEHDSLKSEHTSDLRDRDEEIRLLKEDRTRHALQIKNFTNDLHESKLENSKQNAAINAHALHIESLKGKLSSESDATERLRQQLLHQQEETDRKDREIETVRYRMQEMEMRHENYQKDLIAELQNTREEANVAMTNANELKHRIINLEDELNEAVNGQSRIAEKHFTEIEALRADLQVSQVQSKALEEKLDATQTDAVDLESALREAKRSIEDLEVIRHKLEDKLDVAERERRELEFTMDQKYAAHAAETNALDTNLQQVVHEQRAEQRRVNTLQKQLADLEEEIEQQDTAFREVEKTHLSKIFELRGDLASAEKTNSNLKNELTVVLEQSKAIQPESIDGVPRAKYERLKSDFKTVRAQKEEISTELENAKKSLSMLESTPSTTKVAQEAIAFIHEERAAHLECRTQLNKCKAALLAACKALPVTDNPPESSQTQSSTNESDASGEPRSVYKRPLEIEKSPNKISPAKRAAVETLE